MVWRDIIKIRPGKWVRFDRLGLGQKTDRPKWVVKPMTLTRFFKGWVKTGITHIFLHEYIYIYIINEN